MRKVNLREGALRLAFAAEHVLDLVADHFRDVVAAVREILTGVEVRGVLGKMLADTRSQRQTQVGVDVDLAHRHRSGFTQHILGDTDGIRHLTAELVDLRNVLGHNRGRAVQNDGETGQAIHHFLQDVEAKLGLLTGLELECAVAGADGDGEGVDTRAGNEILHLIGIGVAGVLGRDVDLVFDTCELTELALDGNAVCVSVVNDFLGQRDVLLICR